MNNGQKEWKYKILSFGRFFESYAIGVITPARMGEVLKAGHEEGRQNIFNAAIRVLAERGIDIGIFVSLAGISVLADYYLQIPSVYGWLITLLGATVMFMSVLILTSVKATRFMLAILKKLPGKWGDLSAPRPGYRSKTTVSIIVLSFVSNVSYFISCYLLSQSTGIEAGFLWVTGAVAVSGLLNMLPVTIMGLGTRELVFLYVFKSIADQNSILAFSFMMFLVAQIGGGLVSLIAGQILLFKSKKYSYD